MVTGINERCVNIMISGQNVNTLFTDFLFGVMVGDMGGVVSVLTYRKNPLVFGVCLQVQSSFRISRVCYLQSGFPGVTLHLATDIPQ